MNKNNIETLIYDLKCKPLAILPKYAKILETKLASFLPSMEIYMELKTDDSASYDQTELNVLDNGIAIIEMNGVVTKRLGLPQEVMEYFGLMDLDSVDEQLIAAKNNPEVKSVILNVNSPGGFLDGVVSTANLVDELSQTKETVVYSDMLNASAAYWISSQASSIIGSMDSEFGSIGVFTQITDMSKMMENDGVKVHLIKAGKYKAIGDPTQPLTDEHKAFVQDEINSIYDDFKSSVTKRRKIKEQYMEGQTLPGKKALQAGYIDGIASLNDVINALSI